MIMVLLAISVGLCLFNIGIIIGVLIEAARRVKWGGK